MKALIIGRGESAEMVAGFDLYVGVNDCAYPVNHLICIDPPFVFQPSRQQSIIKHPAKLFTQLPSWANLRQAELINLSRVRHSVEDLKTKQAYPYSNNSPFVAVCHAYFMGADEIVMAGVDMVSHQSLSQPKKVEAIQKHYSLLHSELKRLGCRLYLLKRFGILSDVIPIWANK